MMAHIFLRRDKDITRRENRWTKLANTSLVKSNRSRYTKQKEKCGNGAWRSPEARLNGVQEVAGSNPVAPIYAIHTN